MKSYQGCNCDVLGSSASASSFSDSIVPTGTGFVCLLCKSHLRSRASASRHFLERHVQSDISFLCPICEHKYKNKSSFTDHIYRRHPEMKGADYNRFAVQDGGLGHP